jgi:hypothetical protein
MSWMYPSYIKLPIKNKYSYKYSLYYYKEYPNLKNDKEIQIFGEPILFVHGILFFKKLLNKGNAGSYRQVLKIYLNILKKKKKVK